jgi:hypothetical protein
VTRGDFDVDIHAVGTQRLRAPVYLVWTGDMMIDARAADVWPHVLNYPSWQEYSLVQSVAGTPGQEGELVLLKKEESGLQFPPYYARTVRLEPGRRVIWKVYLDAGAHHMDFFGIVDFRLHDAPGGARFDYTCLYEFMVPYSQESELEAFRLEQTRSFQAVFDVTFPKLKKVAERRA